MKTRCSAFVLVVISPMALLSAGCFLRGAADEPAAEAAKNPAAPSKSEPEAKNESEPKAKNGIVRRLLEKLDDTDADPESIRTVRKMLMEADEELSQALAGNGRSPKSRAASSRRKAPADTSEPSSPAKQETSPAEQETSPAKQENPPDKQGRPTQPGGKQQATAPANPPADKAKTRITAALLAVLDEIVDADEESKDAIRHALWQADSQLAEVLGGKSKERILQANRKPPIRVPVEPQRESSGKTGRGNTEADNEAASLSRQD
ncbi:MAG: hypothetical protein GYA33_00870 [Thermogutta sp.]|nr:hypothetical protein [Thermogutta sp.]